MSRLKINLKNTSILISNRPQKESIPGWAKGREMVRIVKIWFNGKEIQYKILNWMVKQEIKFK